jgi:putative ABC transport system ATP-binding protein
MLKATSLCHQFDYPLLNNVNLTLEPGSKVAVLGVSGSGKSTLLHILSSFMKPKSGTVEIDGEDIYALSDKAMTALRRDYLGLVFQQHYLFRGFTAQENLMIASMLSSHTIDPEILEKLKIDTILHQPVAELSGGQQQRVSIARVLLKKPKIIFADEPTGNLDRETAHDVIGMISDYVDKESGALFMVTHDHAVAEICDTRYILENGMLKLL